MAADVPEVEEPELEDEDVQDDVEDEPEPDEDVQDDVEEASPEDVEEATVELEEDDLVGDDLFDGVDDVEDDGDGSSDGSSDGGESSDGDDGDEDELADLDVGGVAFEESINDGAARLATIGLTDEDMEDSKLSKDELEEEFRQTFEAFRLGHFGQSFLSEYVLTDSADEINPAWGLLGSTLVAAAMVVWLRPDGDQAIEKARGAIENMSGGVA